MNKLILKVLVIILGAVTAAFGLLGLYIAVTDSPGGMRFFHGMHFVLVFLAFPLFYFAYREYGHLLK